MNIIVCLQNLILGLICSAEFNTNIKMQHVQRFTNGYALSIKLSFKNISFCRLMANKASGFPSVSTIMYYLSLTAVINLQVWWCISNLFHRFLSVEMFRIYLLLLLFWDWENIIFLEKIVRIFLLKYFIFLKPVKCETGINSGMS